MSELDGLLGSPGKSQKEAREGSRGPPGLPSGKDSQKKGQEDQGTLKKQVSLDGFSGVPGKSQKGGQEDHGGTLKKLGGCPLAVFITPWSSWPSFWLFPGLPENPLSLGIPSKICQTIWKACLA